MSIELKVPDLGESITEVRIGAWLKEPGDWVDADELLVEIESDKATVQFPSPAAGRLGEITLAEGDDALVGDVMATLDTEATAPEQSREAAQETAPSEVPPARAEAPQAAPVTARTGVFTRLP